ncbi:MAG: hypothetical protein E7354_03145 [Clostridiales bacterium]|nr:hypothetical protein [Clostridiales bacterium]
MRIGAFSGKFYPPHIGHLSVIDKLIDSFDEIWIIISYNPIRNMQIRESTGFETLAPDIIKGWFEKHYESNPRVKVAIFDESGYRPYPEDGAHWAEEFRKQFPTINAKIADESYRDYNAEYFPDYEFVPIDRDEVCIHSTMIRNNTIGLLDKIIPEAREYFSHI